MPRGTRTKKLRAAELLDRAVRGPDMSLTFSRAGLSAEQKEIREEVSEHELREAAMEYFEWESAVIDAVAESMAISHSDAAGVVEAQPFCMQLSWGKGMDAQLTAAKLIEQLTDV